MSAPSLPPAASDRSSDLEKVDYAKPDVDADSDVLSPEDAALEARVWRKLDLWILPVAAMFYLLSFLDRTNLGNAKVANLLQDLKMTPKQYSIALTVTYVPYIVAELPSNLLLRAVGPDRMLPTMITLWGLVATLQGVVHNYSGLLACRFFLGLLEGGVFPGLVLYLSSFYPRARLHWRISLFFSTASISGAFSGILAFAIVHMDGVGGRAGWAWIFILEGAFTVAFGLAAFVLLPRDPARARCLTPPERAYVTRRLRADGALARSDGADDFRAAEIWRACTLPQVWFLAVIFFFDGVILYGLAYFTPSIVQSLGFSPARTQLMSVPPFAAAFAVTLVAAYFSDRYQARGVTAILCSLLCIAGFAIFLTSTSHHVQYGSLFLSIPGTYCSAPALSTWSANNAAPHARRATAIAIGFIMTNAGGICATWLLGSLSPPPRYTRATRTLLGMSVGMAALCAANLAYLAGQNRRKRAVRAAGARRADEDPALGDRSAWFVYNL